MKRILSITLHAVVAGAIFATGLTANADAAELRTSKTKLKLKTAQTMQTGKAGATGLAGNGYVDAKADLIIVPQYGGSGGLPGTGYCGPWNGGNPSVKFFVKNIGDKAAPASDVYIGFGGSNFAVKAVPAIGAGQQVAVSHPIPANAWSNHAHPSVQVLVAADHNDDVTEESVANNYGNGTCIGPAT
jgi:hypothetical protein